MSNSHNTINITILNIILVMPNNQEIQNCPDALNKTLSELETLIELGNNKEGIPIEEKRIDDALIKLIQELDFVLKNIDPNLIDHNHKYRYSTLINFLKVTLHIRDTYISKLGEKQRQSFQTFISTRLSDKFRSLYQTNEKRLNTLLEKIKFFEFFEKRNNKNESWSDNSNNKDSDILNHNCLTEDNLSNILDLYDLYDSYKNNANHFFDPYSRDEEIYSLIKELRSLSGRYENAPFINDLLLLTHSD